ncbi:MAG TPA: hypothetical protein VJ978_13180 [Nitriliruptoraceae bacterium]|nr:hypothetical protein [Nitriliruptoraceae bacterium]
MTTSTEPPDRASDAEFTGDVAGPASAPEVVLEDGDEPEVALVDWGLAGRRLALSAVVLLAVALGAWIVTSLVVGAWRPGVLGNFVGLALVGVFLVEIWVVGGSALRGMLRAGEAGHRLAGSDVGLLPPQLRPGGSMKPPLAKVIDEQVAARESQASTPSGDDDRPGRRRDGMPRDDTTDVDPRS